MVSESDLVTRLREILRSSDLDTTTPASVRRQLEADFGVDLSDKKAFVRDQIDLFLQQQQQPEENDAVGGEKVEENDAVEAEEESDGEDEEEEKEERPVKVKKRGGGGFNKLCRLSPQLEKVVGVPELARTQVVKKIWKHIRENNLQDPNNRRKIICDESLHALFRVKSIDMFQMNKALSKHIWPLSESDGSVRNTKKEEEDKEEEEGEEKEEENDEEESEEAEQSNKRRNKRKKSARADKSTNKRRGGFTKLCSLSIELQAFTGESKLARTEVVKKLWSYIKENNLQDPMNKRQIICDDSLRNLFRVDSIGMFQMNKALTEHIRPLEEGKGSPDDSPEKGKQKQEQEEEEEEKEEEEEEEEKEEEEEEEAEDEEEEEAEDEEEEEGEGEEEGNTDESEQKDKRQKKEGSL